MPKLKVPHFSDIDPKTKKTLSGSIILIAVLAIVLMTVFHSTDGFTAIVETEPATMVTERDYMTFTAYTLKNEKIVTSRYSGGRRSHETFAHGREKIHNYLFPW